MRKSSEENGKLSQYRELTRETCAIYKYIKSRDKENN